MYRIFEILTNGFNNLILYVVKPLYDTFSLGALLLGLFFVYSAVRFLLMPLSGFLLVSGSDTVKKESVGPYYDSGVPRIEKRGK